LFPSAWSTSFACGVQAKLVLLVSTLAVMGRLVRRYSPPSGSKSVEFLQEAIIQPFPTVGSAVRAISGSVPEKARGAPVSRDN